MALSDQEKAEVNALIKAGEVLPDRYRHLLFREPRETELIWPGKTHEVSSVVLPFQSIEQIDEPRAEVAAKQSDLFEMDGGTGRQSGGWSNKLIWGDNKLVLSSLKNGPLRREIENAGGLKLVYIDPPFDVGADFSFDIEVGDSDTVTKEPSVIEDIAYRDTWGKGADSFVAMLYARLILIRDLLSEDGSIYVHCDPRVSAFVRLILNETFGSDYFRSEIIWKRTSAHSDASVGFGDVTDNIFFYTRSADAKWNQLRFPLAQAHLDAKYTYREPDGRLFATRDLRSPHPRPNLTYDYKGYKPHSNGWSISRELMEQYDREGRIYFPANQDGRIRLKIYLDEAKGLPLQNLWTDIPPINSQAQERSGYPTQKPIALLERILNASSASGDLVADFFCGSGTTLVVAEKLGRKWIGCDLGRFAIHTARKRLIGVQRELKAASKPYRAFEILNLGKYERQYFAGIDPTLPEEQRRVISVQKEEHYVSLILFAYKGERVFQSPPFHGRKGGTLVLVGPLDAPVTRFQVDEAVDAARKLRATRIDVLGFEFEMGLSPYAIDEAKAKGVSLALRFIPKEVFDKRAVDKNQIVFYEVAYVEMQPVVKGLSVTVKLKDFGVSYRQDDADALAGEMNAGTKVTVDGGQVVKITKDKAGLVTKEILTKQWTDWIDYWSVDFDYASKPETIVITSPDASGKLIDRPQWTGGYIFENEWQSFRTRRDRSLELTSAAHEYEKKGKYKIAVKVIDIFGNDTTKVVEVSV